MDRHRSAGLIGLAAFGIVSAASAADIPGNKSTRAVLKTGLSRTSGAFERKGDTDWYRVTLKGGQNYALVVNAGCLATLNLRNLSGKVLGSATGGFGQDRDAGFEFRSPSTRTFFVEFADACRVDDPHSYPPTYSGSVAADARGDPTTAATIAVGQTIHGINNSSDDVDYFRTRLTRGKTYTLSASISVESSVSIVDSRRNLVAAIPHGQDSATGIKVPATGTYYVVVYGTDDFEIGSFSVTLTSP